MAYRAGSVVVDIVGKAEALKRTFKEAKDSVKEFGSQIKETDTSIKKVGRSLVDSLAEPRSVFGWLNKMNNSLKQIDYVAGRGFVRTGSSARQMASDIEKAQASLAKAQSKLALASEHYAVAAVNAMGKDIKGAKAKETQAQKSQENARAKVEEAKAALASAQAIDRNTRSSDQNSNAKTRNTAASRQAKMADLDLVFAAMYAQIAIAGIINKLEDIYNKGTKTRMALMGLESTVRGLGESVDEATATFKYFQEDGLMSDQEIAASMKNLLHMGYTIEDTRSIMNAFKDSAAFGRQASLGFGEAIVRSTEGMRLGLSTLSDGAGMAKNLGQILAENGYAADDLSRATTDAGVRQALLNGILKETKTSAGDAAKMAKDLSGSMAKLGAESNKLNTSVLTAMSGLLNSLAQAITPIITLVRQWIDENPRLTTAIIAVTIVMLALVSACLIWQFVFPMIMKGFKELIKILTFMTGPIGLTIAAITVLGIIIASNFDLIVESCKQLYEGWSNYFSLMWKHMKNFGTAVADMFSGMGKIIAGAFTLDVDKIMHGVAELRQGLVNAGEAIVGSSAATTMVITATLDTAFRKLDPVKLFGNAWDKVKGIFDPVNVDMSDKPANPRPQTTPKEKDKKGASGPSPYQIAMREYDHKVHMDELKEYEEKMEALALIGATVEMTAEEQMKWSEDVYTLTKEHNEDLKRYATEYMQYQVATGQKTVEQQLEFIEEQLKNEKDKYQKIQLMQQAYDIRQKLKQYDSDYIDYQIKIGKKTLQDKLDIINQEIDAEKDKFKKLALLNQQFELASKIHLENSTNQVNRFMQDIDKGTTRNIADVISDLRTIEKHYRSLGAVGKEAADQAKDAIESLNDATDHWVNDVTDGLARVVLGFDSFKNFINNLFNEIALSFVRYQLNQIMGGAIGQMFQGMPWMYSGKGHTGGYVSRYGGVVSKYHDGGLIGGLQQDERVIIGQTGERILNRKETTAYEAGRRSSGGGDTPIINNYYNISAMDSASFQDFAARNRSIFGAAVAQDFVDGGAMKKALSARR